jgi:hypothetical protein
MIRRTNQKVRLSITPDLLDISDLVSRLDPPDPSWRTEIPARFIDFASRLA